MDHSDSIHHSGRSNIVQGSGREDHLELQGLEHPCEARDKTAESNAFALLVFS